MAKKPRIGCVETIGGRYHLTEIGLMHVLELASLGSSPAEIARYLRVDRGWMADRLNEEHDDFDEDMSNAYEDGLTEFRKRLREGQSRLADVNAQMSIHLGKHYLDQKDVQHVEVSKKIQIVGTLPDYSQTADDWSRQFAPTPLQPQPAQKIIDAVDADFEERE